MSLFEVIEFYVFVGLTDVDSRLLFLLKTEHNIESILCSVFKRNKILLQTLLSPEVYLCIAIHVDYS